MKKIRLSLMILLILINAIFTSGCWNYREIDKLAIVAGVAVDKGTDGQYIVTAEVIQMSGGKDSKTASKIITMEGKTLFDAVRNGIALTGKRLYWSHSEVIILSKDIAAEGVSKVTDWYIRDSETREDVSILISVEASAREILQGETTTDDVKSMTLGDIIKNQQSLSKAPTTDVLLFDIETQAKGMSTVIPTVSLKQIDGKKVPQIMGAAIIKDDKLVGQLNGEETRDLIFIRDEIKGGVLLEGTNGGDIAIPVSLEIFKSKTKVAPVVEDKNIMMKLNIETTVAIDEIDGSENYIDDKGRRVLEQNAENTLKGRIESLVKKVQSEYDADIFKFGSKLREDDVKAWNSVGDKWEEVFKDLKLEVETKVHVKNSAVLSKTLEKGG